MSRPPSPEIKKHPLLLLSIIIAVIFIVSALPLNADSGFIRFFLDRKPVAVKSTVKDGEIYVSLKDLAELVPERFEISADGKKIDIYRTKPLNSTAVQPAPQEYGVSGRILWSDGNEIQFPVENIEVFLYIQNQDITDSEANDAFRRQSLGADDDYAKNHGLVRKTVTGGDGGFNLGRVPPGKYEITALVPSKGGSSGIFWRKRITVNEKEAVRVIFDRSGAVGF